MADFPSNLWIREPAVDGRLIQGGGLNREMAKLAQMRAEITAIETALGTNVRGSAASLLARLAVRHAPSGLKRGQTHCLRGSNSSPSSPSGIENWFEGGNNYIQVGIKGPITSGASSTITFPRAYFAGNPPNYVIVKFCCDTTFKRVGNTQIFYDSITINQFVVQTKRFNAAGSFTTPSVAEGYYVTWIAVGGIPGS